ncbi:GAP family protein [Aeromicrobium sp. CnD17-E]|uniref:GAP family protein n=1 Tax=Aeromicrobium sp. CnD17-E TaxID=2954487 RepID=UPI002097BDEB|nr:GAP family protein [Aeromicrobium sp. CnD17-E]MCO7239656.1 GAP family protein [Aeromicrobium sp. CnD17-E]
MTWAVLGGLVLLALVDSTSAGTLLLPLWMLVAPRVRPARVLLFLTTVAVFYAAVGVVLLLGVDAVLDAVSGAGDTLARNRPLAVVQLLVGAALFWWSWPLERRAKERGGPSPRAVRWRAALQGEGVPARTTVLVALVATVLELATMLPYLAAMGLLSRSGLDRAWQLLVLLGYVVVMVLPALVLLALRLVAARRVEPWLERADAWMTARSGVAVSWIVGLVGFLVGADALSRLTT